MQRTCRNFIRTLVSLPALVPSFVAGQPLDIDGESLTVVRQEFVAAFAAESRGESVRTESAQLREYALYPYLQAARLERALELADPSSSDADRRAAEFLAEFGAEPVGAALRRSWLESLARRDRWQPFLEHYDPGVATEALECLELGARIALGRTNGIAESIGAIWLTPRQLPIACEPPFQWLRERGLLDDALTERRVRLLLENGQARFARVIARRLPERSAAPLLDWARMLRDPAAGIDALLADPERRIDSAALLEGFGRLARDAPESALSRFEPLQRLLDGDSSAQSRVALALALGLAWDRHPLARDFFARVEPEHLDDYALQWLARSALWSSDFALVDRAVAGMSEEQRAEAAWRYWAARAAEALEDTSRARALYESLSTDDNYYSVMAAARLGRRTEPHAAALPIEETELRRLAAIPALLRARELQFSGLRSRATLEWRHADRDLSTDERRQSIHLAARWQLHDIAVATATSLEIFDDYALLYPRVYLSEIADASKLTRVETNLLLGLVRQESLFRPDAVSAAGGLGLAQLQIGTATITAERWELPRPSRADLLTPASNLRLAAARLRDLLDDVDGQLPVALAAYNAGFGAARRWLPPGPVASDIWIENIPFNETRAYVRRVLWHGLVYEWNERERALSTRAWIDEVRPLAEPD